MLKLLLIAAVCNLVTMTFRSYRTVLGIVAPILVMSLSLIMVMLMSFSTTAIIIAIYINLSLFAFSIFVIKRVVQIKAEVPIDDFTGYWERDDNDRILVKDRFLTTRATKMFVWQRDKGRCVACGSIQNLEFNYIVPCSKGGLATDNNIQLLCQNCNHLQKEIENL